MRDKRLVGHMPPLDGVRGIAILSVMVFHGAGGLPLPASVRLLTSFGWAGVDLFFALSGFLITGLLIDARGKPDYYRRFYARRTRRIVPLYMLYVLVLLLVAPVGSWVAWYTTWTMNIQVAAANSWKPAIAGTAFFWSLCVEEQFYAIWPTVVARVSDRALLRVVGVLAVAAFLIRTIFVVRGHIFAAYVLLPCRMDGLALGAGAAVVARRPGGLDWMAKRAPAVLVGAAAGFAMVVFHTAYAGWDNPIVATVGFSLTAIAATALVVLSVAVEPTNALHRLVTFPALRFSGRRAYGLYVLAGAGVLLAQTLGARGYAEALLAAALSFVLAEVSWRILERPALTVQLRRTLPRPSYG